MTHSLPAIPRPTTSRPTQSRWVCGLVLAVSLGGCALTDPYEKPGNWRPMDANALNLELQVAHPTDLAQGRGTEDSDGASAALAIDRLRQDKVKPLVDIDTSGASSSGSGNGGGS